MTFDIRKKKKKDEFSLLYEVETVLLKQTESFSTLGSPPGINSTLFVLDHVFCLLAWTP